MTAYRYNGLNWRIAVQHDDDNDQDLDANDLTYYHVYDERWRPVATFREDGSDPKEQFVYHAPGNDGFGGAGYIDDVILRDKDADTDWDVQADGTLEERIYYCQNWRHDVVALIDASGGGQQVEQVRYEAYGVPHLFFAGDVDADGSVETADVNTIQGWIDTFAYDVRGDVDLDGDVDATDKSTVQNAVGVKGGGRGVLTVNTGNRKAYAGYEYDDTFAHDAYHVRNRVLSSSLGQWLGPNHQTMRDSSNNYAFRSDPIPLPLFPIDAPGCTTIQDCAQDPCVQSAMAYVIASCPFTQYTVTCNNGGVTLTRCSTRIINIPSFATGSRCSRLAHELIHAGDLCQHGQCSGTASDTFGGGSGPDCNAIVCSELRAIRHGCCADPTPWATAEACFWESYRRVLDDPVTGSRLCPVGDEMGLFECCLGVSWHGIMPCNPTDLEMPSRFEPCCTGR